MTNIRASISKFVETAKTKPAQLLASLGLSESVYTEFSHSSLMDNPEDIANGVIRVCGKVGLSIFGIFTTGLIKYHDDDEKEFIFFTETKNAIEVKHIFNSFSELLGEEIFDGRTYAPYSDDNIDSISKGNFKNVKNGVAITWIVKPFTITVKYLTSPACQLALMVCFNPPRQVDYSIRRRTVKEVLNFNVSEILDQSDIQAKSVENADGVIIDGIIDYTSTLTDPVVGVFDVNTIRLFSKQKHFTKQTETHVTLTCSKPTGLGETMKVLESLLVVCGPDNTGEMDVRPYEIAQIENELMWTGRYWWFNEKNGIQDTSKNEPLAYMVQLDRNLVSNGLSLQVDMYNVMLDLFTVANG